MSDKAKKATLERYISYFETLRVETIDQLDELVVTDVRFVDPFQDVTGVEEMKYVLSKMFDDVIEPQFEVTDWAMGQKDAAYLRWCFTFKSKKGSKIGKEWRFRGVSEVQFNEDSKIRQHIDHWDSATQLYEKLPGVGTAVGFLKRKVAS